MQTKTVCRFARIPRTVCLIALSAVIFTGILVLMVFALALTANGMITLPSAFIRIIGKGSIFVSDLSEYTMLFFRSGKPFLRAWADTSERSENMPLCRIFCLQTFFKD